MGFPWALSRGVFAWTEAGLSCSALTQDHCGGSSCLLAVNRWQCIIFGMGKEKETSRCI